MAFLVFTGTYVRTIMWPTVWRTALSQLYLCCWAGCWKNNPFPRKESDISFIAEVTIIFCWFFGWLFATFFFFFFSFSLLVHTISSSLGVLYDDALAVCSPIFYHLWCHVHNTVKPSGMRNISHATVGCCWSTEGMHSQWFPVDPLYLAKAKVH